MTHPTLFETFLKEIRLSDKEEFKAAHTRLRDLLGKDTDLSPRIVATFLQGSYKRYTALRPEGDSKPDVDVVVVTDLDSASTTPSEAMGKFEPFLEANYKDAWEYQSRSICVVDGEVELDLVVTSAPSAVTRDLLFSEVIQRSASIVDLSEAAVTFSKSLQNSVLFRAAGATDDWKSDPLLIPDRTLKEWRSTDPIAQISWTTLKNKNTSGHYVNVVKALKWWKRVDDTLPKYPKGYPLEHLVGQNCPDDIGSVEEGIVLTLENIVSNYAYDVATGTKPTLPDHGVPDHDVLARVTPEEFKAFYEGTKRAATATRAAYDSQVKAESWKAWYEFFGNPFPKPEEDAAKSMSERLATYSATPRNERFG